MKSISVWSNRVAYCIVANTRSFWDSYCLCSFLSRLPNNQENFTATYGGSLLFFWGGGVWGHYLQNFTLLLDRNFVNNEHKKTTLQKTNSAVPQFVFSQLLTQAYTHFSKTICFLSCAVTSRLTFRFRREVHSGLEHVFVC